VNCSRWTAQTKTCPDKQFLETSNTTIEAVARRCGFGSVDTLGLHFTRQVGTTPTSYRKTFGDEQ
jgi:AraC family transcriptional regulator, transcriptional activator FtrA